MQRKESGRAAFWLSAGIRTLLFISAGLLLWSFVHFSSYKSFLGGFLLSGFVGSWYLASMGVFPLLLLARLWLDDGKGARIDIVMVTGWVLAMLVLAGIVFSKPYVPVWSG